MRAPTIGNQLMLLVLYHCREMPHSHHHHHLATASLLLQLLVLAHSSASSADVISSFFPALDDDQTAHGLLVSTRSFSLSPASFLFDAQIFPAFNRSRGFVLLSHPVRLWDDGDTAAHTQQQVIREASFNTTFTVVHGAGVSTVAFVILLDSLPPQAVHPSVSNSSAFSGGASDSIAAVEVGAVTSYGRLESPDVGLNITVMFNSTAASRSSTVWIEYSAVAHHLWVYVAGGGEPKPVEAMLEASFNLTSRHITQHAFVGFFAAKVRDVIHGVRNWEVSFDKFPGGGGGGGGNEVEGSRTEETPWLRILLVVLGLLAAMACVVSVAVCFRISRGRRELKMEHIMKQIYPRPAPTRRTEGT